MPSGNLGAPGSVPGRPFVKGDPRAGKGKPGRAGRPSTDVREQCVKLLRGKRGQRSAYQSLALILSNPDHPHFAQAVKIVMAYAYGQPKATVQVDGEPPVIRIVRDQAAVEATVRAAGRDDE